MTGEYSPLICCCSLAGTAACKNCNTRKRWENQMKVSENVFIGTGDSTPKPIAIGQGSSIGKACIICGRHIPIYDAYLADKTSDICEKCCKRLKHILYYEED